jgi:hypothetical protein
LAFNISPQRYITNELGFTFINTDSFDPRFNNIIFQHHGCRLVTARAAMGLQQQYEFAVRVILNSPAIAADDLLIRESAAIIIRCRRFDF